MRTSEKRDYSAPKSTVIEVRYERPIADPTQGAQGGTEEQGGEQEG